ncbi:MAG: hypothetical protein GF375_02935 [Candidatus Omnitrophica bacterium]|nr:hypothetical protein [Candidatus Omnitrophota bacterium]MBD3269053.1 hypothetical protein [Candidatus Omnitrophota bacterium]
MARENNIVENIIGLREGLNNWLLEHVTPSNIVFFVFAVYAVGTAVYIFDFSTRSYKDGEWRLSLKAFRNILGFNFFLLLFALLFIFAFPEGRFTEFAKNFLENNSALLIKGAMILFAVSVLSTLTGIVYHFMRMRRY